LYSSLFLTGCGGFAWMRLKRSHGRLLITYHKVSTALAGLDVRILTTYPSYMSQLCVLVMSTCLGYVSHLCLRIPAISMYPTSIHGAIPVFINLRTILLCLIEFGFLNNPLFPIYHEYTVCTDIHANNCSF